MITREEALNLIRNTSRYSHALVTSSIMRRLAKKLKEDEKKWELTGLLHDLDYDQVRDDVSKHGVVASETLEGELPEDCLYAIKSHDHRTGFKPKGRLDKALVISDSLAIIIEKIGEKLEYLSLNDIEAEINRVSIVEPWLKKNIMGCEEIGITRSELYQIAQETRLSPTN